MSNQTTAQHIKEALKDRATCFRNTEDLYVEAIILEDLTKFSDYAKEFMKKPIKKGTTVYVWGVREGYGIHEDGTRMFSTPGPDVFISTGPLVRGFYKGSCAIVSPNKLQLIGGN